MAFTSVMVSLLVIFGLTCATHAANIRFLDNASNVFGGQERTFTVTVDGVSNADGVFAWQLVSNGRVLARREIASGNDTVSISVPVPEVRDDVVFEATLGVTWTGRDSTTPGASSERRLWIYPQNPFSGHREALEKESIVLFDPSGETAAIFKGAGIPFRAVANVDALAEITSGLVIVGAGALWSQYRGLPDIMVGLVASGVPVLCLGPAPGIMPLPGTSDGDARMPARLQLSNGTFIRQLDKTLDVPMSVVSIRITPNRGAVQAEVSDARDGWTFLEADYGRASLILCTADITGTWEAGPAPRYLLARLIEYLTKEKHE